MKHFDLCKDILFLKIDYDDKYDPSQFFLLKREKEILVFDEDFYNMFVIENIEDLEEFVKKQEKKVEKDSKNYWIEDKNNNVMQVLLE